MVNETWQLIENSLNVQYIQGEFGRVENFRAFEYQALPCSMICHIQNGEMDLTFKNCAHSETLKHDDILFLPANTLYSRTIRPDPVMLVNWLHFNVLIYGGINLLAMLGKPLVFKANSSLILREAITNCIGDSKAYAKAPSLPLMIRKKQLGLKIVEVILKCGNIEAALISSLANLSRLRPVIEYIDKHLTEPLRRQDLARQVNLSCSRCDALFKENLGISPMDYLINKRIDKAQVMLISTTLSIMEIASQVGYDDPYYFSRLFKKRTENSPREYRMKASNLFFV